MRHRMVGAHAAAAGGFVPSDIANLAGWWDASDGATITSSGGSVSQWNDKSANANHVTASGITKPSTGNNTINSRNVIDMTADQFFTKTPATGIVPTDVSIFAVYRKTGANNTYEAFPILLDNGSNTGGPFDGWDDGASPRLYVTSGSATGYASIRGHTTATQVTVTIDQDGAGFQNDTVEQRVNGSVYNSANIPAVWSQTGQTIRIGLRSDGVTKFTGDIAELIVYNALLTGANLTNVESYLKAKWGTP